MDKKWSSNLHSYQRCNMTWQKQERQNVDERKKRKNHRPKWKETERESFVEKALKKRKYWGKKNGSVHHISDNRVAIARFLKDNLITDILNIKYINSYEILIQFSNEVSLKELITCQAAIDIGWRIYKTLEIESFYGVIRKVKLDLKQ